MNKCIIVNSPENPDHIKINTIGPEAECYYIKPHLQIIMPTSLSLRNPYNLSNNMALLWREPENNSSLSSQTPTKGSLSDSESIRYFL